MGGKQKSMSGTSASLAQSAHSEQRQDNASNGAGAEIDAPTNSQTFDDALKSALAEGKISDARTLVSNAEAVLQAHGSTTAEAADDLTGAVQLAAAKARIAMATGDGLAARAILVKAIEKNPATPSLKALMTEVMMAGGRASDVRPVLQHLGKQPTKVATPEIGTPSLNPTLRGSSS